MVPIHTEIDCQKLFLKRAQDVGLSPHDQGIGTKILDWFGEMHRHPGTRPCAVGNALLAGSLRKAGLISQPPRTCANLARAVLSCLATIEPDQYRYWRDKARERYFFYRPELENEYVQVFRAAARKILPPGEE